MSRSCLFAFLFLGLITATAAAATDARAPRFTPLPGAAAAPLLPALDPLGNFNQGFETSSFPPAGWSLAGSTSLWSRSTACSAYGTGFAAALADFYSVPSGQQDLITPAFLAAGPNDSLRFDHAYATYTTEIDRLQVSTSTNGGATWTTLITLNGGVSGPLNTGGAVSTGAFVPTAAQWATKAYLLPVGTNRIRFTALSAYGNELYVDNIRITGASPTHDVNVTTISAPVGQVQSPVTPSVYVGNNGSSTETFLTTFAIDSGGVEVYRNSQNVSSLAAGATRLVTFATWTPALGNIYGAKAFTALSGDQVPANDTVRTAVNSFNLYRRVFVEDFTAQWCQYCPYVQNSLQQLRAECGDSVVVVALHPSASSDSFYTLHSADVSNFYGNIPGYPTTVWDGGDQIVGGWSAVYADHRAEFDKRKLIKSPFSISLNGVQVGDSGLVQARIEYPGGVPISGNIKMAVIEESKYCHWPSGTGYPIYADSMRDFLRDMFPSSSGDPITISHGTAFKDIRFTLGAWWNKARLHFLVYVNDMTTKEVFNVGEIAYEDLIATTDVPMPIPMPVGRMDLLPISPNPITGSAVLSYSLPVAGRVRLGVFDITGRLVMRMVDGSVSAGYHSVTWHGTDQGGQRIASGVYFVRLEAAGDSRTRRVTVVW
jgi:hypothetical protein